MPGELGPKRHSPMSRRAPSLARNSAPNPQVSFVHPNRFSVLSEVEEENDEFETVETNPSSVHPKNYEVSQAPRSRNQNPELRTRPGRKLNLGLRTTPLQLFLPLSHGTEKSQAFLTRILSSHRNPRLTMTTRSATSTFQLIWKNYSGLEGRLMDRRQSFFKIRGQPMTSFLRSLCVNMEWKRGL